MLEGLGASTLKGTFERYAVTRAQITLLYFLLGSMPTSKFTPLILLSASISLCFSLHYIDVPSWPQQNPMYTMRVRISGRHAAFRPALPSVTIRHTNTEPGVCFGWECWGTNTASGPLSWKWFYSFNIISLNNDSVVTWQVAASWIGWKAD